MKLSDLTNKTPDDINRMSAKQLSDAVAYMARHANKRVENLKKHGYKAPVYDESKKKIVTKWVNKKTSPGLDFNAIQNLNKSFGHVNQFTNIGRLRSEYIRVQGFLKAKSSTVAGAIELRKKKERALFGATRGELVAKENRNRMKKGESPMSKAARQTMISNMDEFMSSVYENYHKWREEYAMEGGYTKEQGSASLSRIGRLMARGMPAGLARYNESRRMSKEYETRRQAVSEETAAAEKSPFSILHDDENKDVF